MLTRMLRYILLQGLSANPYRPGNAAVEGELELKSTNKNLPSSEVWQKFIWLSV